jgi:hypothetical protein
MSARRGHKKKVLLLGLGAVVGAALVAGLVLVTRSPSLADEEAAHQHEINVGAAKSLAANAITVPVARLTDTRTSEVGHPIDFSFKRDGTPVDSRTEYDRAHLPVYSTQIVAADGALPFSLFTTRLVEAYPKSPAGWALGFVIGSPHLQGSPATDGSGLRTLSVQFDDAFDDDVAMGQQTREALSKIPGLGRGVLSPDMQALGVLVDADTARLFSLRTRSPIRASRLTATLPLDDTPAASTERRRVLSAARRGNPQVETLVLAPAPGNTVGRVVTLLVAIAAELDDAKIDLVVTPDRGALERAEIK